MRMPLSGSGIGDNSDAGFEEVGILRNSATQALCQNRRSNATCGRWSPAFRLIRGHLGMGPRHSWQFLSLKAVLQQGSAIIVESVDSGKSLFRGCDKSSATARDLRE